MHIFIYLFDFMLFILIYIKIIYGHFFIFGIDILQNFTIFGTKQNAHIAHFGEKK